MICRKPYPASFRFLDTLLMPVMYLLAGTLEAPQETHPWNIQKIALEQKDTLNLSQAVVIDGTYNGFLGKKQGGPLFHAPVFGGWKEYVVLEASHTGAWFVGWFVDRIERDYFHISRLMLHDSRVRLLKPPADTVVTFFAFDAAGNQITLARVGEGSIGDGGEFARIRLL